MSFNRSDEFIVPFMFAGLIKNGKLTIPRVMFEYTPNHLQHDSVVLNNAKAVEDFLKIAPIMHFEIDCLNYSNVSDIYINSVLNAID